MLSSSRSPLFSKSNSGEQQLRDESTSANLFIVIIALISAHEAQLTAERETKAQTSEHQTHPDDPSVKSCKGVLIQTHSTPFVELLREFDRRLILQSRTDANKYAEQAIANVIPESGKQNGVTLKDLCRQFHDETQIDQANAISARDCQTLDMLIRVFASARAFQSMKNLIDKLDDGLKSKLSKSLEVAYFKALHFGDADTVKFLLQHGLNPNLVETEDFLGRYRPLNLLVYDMDRCLHYTESLMKDAESGTSTKYGTLDELKQFLAARMSAYKKMATSLIEYGADLDDTFSERVAGTDSPRQAAGDYLVKIQKRDTSNSYTSENVALMSEVLYMMVNGPKLELESEIKRMKM